MTDLGEQILIDEIVAQFIRRCEHLWPGCIVTIKQKPGQPLTAIPRGSTEAQQREFARRRDATPDLSGKTPDLSGKTGV